MARIKLADWAKKNGLSYLTANRYFHAGMIPNAQQLDSGTILVEDNSSEQTMVGGSANNDAMSLFLKKTVEFSKNNSTVEDFAAYIITNFTLKINGVVDGPKYSKRPPKSEDIQKHFQQFIPKPTKKPESNSFVMNSEDFAEIFDTTAVSIPNANTDLVQEFIQAVDLTCDVFPGSNPTTVSNTPPMGDTVAMSTESTITRNVDLNSTPQTINYTGSNDCTFGGSLSFVPTTTIASISNVVSQNSSLPTGGSIMYCAATTMLDDEEPKLSLQSPRAKRGRKPNKR